MAKFRVSATIYKTDKSPRTSVFDGPWKASPEEALDAFKAKLVKQGLDRKGLFKPFVAEQLPRGMAPEADSRYGYQRLSDQDAATQLNLRGLRAFK